MVYKKESKLDQIISGFFPILFFIMLPLTLLTSISLSIGGGLSTLNQDLVFFLFYVSTGGIYFLVLYIIHVLGVLTQKNDKYWYVEGMINRTRDNVLVGKYLIFNNWFLFTLFTFIVFGIIGYFTTFVQQISLWHLPTLQSGLNHLSQFILSIDPATISESAIASLISNVVVYFGGFGLFGWKEWTILRHFLIAGANAAVMILFGIAFHFTRYADQPLALGNTIIFWGVLGFLSAFFLTIIPLFTGHYSQNGSFSLKNWVGIEKAKDIWIIWLISLIIIFIISYIMIKKNQEQRGKRKK